MFGSGTAFLFPKHEEEEKEEEEVIQKEGELHVQSTEEEKKRGRGLSVPRISVEEENHDESSTHEEGACPGLLRQSSLLHVATVAKKLLEELDPSLAKLKNDHEVSESAHKCLEVCLYI